MKKLLLASLILSFALSTKYSSALPFGGSLASIANSSSCTKAPTKVSGDECDFYTLAPNKTTTVTNSKGICQKDSVVGLTCIPKK